MTITQRHGVSSKCSVSVVWVVVGQGMEGGVIGGGVGGLGMFVGGGGGRSVHRA